jgi:hypothetical protein
MRTRSKNILSFRTLGSAHLLSAATILNLPFMAHSAPVPQAQRPVEAPAGIAWDVRGQWQVGGKGAPILTGDALLPGSLIQPDDGTGAHAISVLLPDGQRIFYECFTEEDCSRGFRVPPLYRRPEPFTGEMMARIRAGLARERDAASTGSGVQRSPQMARDEAVAVLGPDNRVSVAGLAASLPNGRYTYTLRPLDRAYPREFHLVIEKTGPSITLALPSSGLYVLTIADDLNTPRIDLFIAAVTPAAAARVKKSFGDARVLMAEWNSDSHAWPIHDFQRAYLESLIGAKPLSTGTKASLDDKITPGAGASAQGSPPEFKAGDRQVAAEMHQPDVTAEPTFSPKSGMFDGDTAVTLRCETPGAAIHFTVDGSQPVASSPVYEAPIMVKGSELTIKSFARVAGKKDSAVVTGVFRIRE